MTKSQNTDRAFFLGQWDAESGRDYANPYIPPVDADETYVWNEACEQAYHDGYCAYCGEVQ